MLHVDDAQLHAYLDGELETVEPGATAAFKAHLAACVVCAARLEEASRLRDRAGAILRTAEPSRLRLRDFASVAAAPQPPSRRKAPDHRRAMQRRATALAWAASLVVALGIGWLARDLQVTRGVELASRDVDSRAAAPAGAPASPEVVVAGERRPAERLAAAVEAPPEPAPAAVAGAAAPAPTAPDVALDAPPPVSEVAVGSGPPADRAPVEAEAIRLSSVTFGAERTLAAPAAPAEPGVEIAERQPATVARGRVTGATGEGVAHATVSIPALHAGTLTASDGSYALTVPAGRLAETEELSIQVAGIGYRPQSRPLALRPGGTATADFELEPAGVALEAVAVTAAGAGREPRAEQRQRARPLAAAPRREAAAEAHEPVVAKVTFGAAQTARCDDAPVSYTRDTGATSLTAVATARMVDAGAGGTEYVVPPTARPGSGIRGRLMEVARVGGAGAREVERAFSARGSREVVVVTWALDGACLPSPSRDDPYWLEPGSTLFLTARLREREEWRDGVPTFDLHLAAAMAYPLQPGRGADEGDAARLTADEYFELYRALPTRDELERDPDRAARAIDRWAAAHPELARRQPAIHILDALRDRIADMKGSS